MPIRPADHGIVAAQGGEAPIEATGGTIVDAGGYRTHTFTASGTFEVTSLGTQSGAAEFLVVAGGGGGGAC